jgi:signal recognition particle receptor subunit beta
MVQINFAQKSVTVKIVYYGPGMSGKTTNLEIVHQRAPEASRGELTSISTDGDRTLFFDFMPLDLGTVAGMRTQFQIYTVPGQVYYNSTRKLVLQGVDGVIFVADSSASMVEENLESLRNLADNLADYGKDLAELPLVIQYNKRDLPDAMSVEELDRLLNPNGLPSFEAVANTGQGVFPTLKALAARVLECVHRTSGATGPAPAARPQTAAAAERPVLAAPSTEGPAPDAGTHEDTLADAPAPAALSYSASEAVAPATERRQAPAPEGSALRLVGGETPASPEAAPRFPVTAPAQGPASPAQPGPLRIAASLEADAGQEAGAQPAPVLGLTGLAAHGDAAAAEPAAQAQPAAATLTLQQPRQAAHETAQPEAAPRATTRAGLMQVDADQRAARPAARRSASIAPATRIRPRTLAAPTPAPRRRAALLTVAAIGGAMAVGIAMGALLFQVL